jgi:hypothetical protein
MAGIRPSATKHNKKGQILNSMLFHLVAQIRCIKKRKTSRQFHQSFRYETFRQRLRDILRNFCLQNLPRSIRLYLLRRRRLPKVENRFQQDMLVQTKIMNHLKLQFIRTPAYSIYNVVQSSRSNHPFLMSNHIFVQAYNLSAPAAELFV